MNFKLDILKKEEKAILSLSSLYSDYGYKKYKVGNFEEYNFYLQYKSFLSSEKILSFTDLDGSLLALKPDITLSVIKNTNATLSQTEKHYYVETVYRESKGSNTFKEISQIGLEYIGNIDGYAIAETVHLARESLARCSESYILELGHMGFVTGLLETLKIKISAKEKILEFLSTKSQHELLNVAKKESLSENDTERLLSLCTLSGEFYETLQRAKKICVGGKMHNAISELEEIYNAVVDEPDAKMRLDFALLNDTEYYDGILFAGYLKGLPRAILSGGRYDNMMEKLGKPANAIGFALYLNELERLDTEKSNYDVDILIFSDKTNDTEKVLKEVTKLISLGQRVRVEANSTTEIRYKHAYRFINGGLEEC